MNLETNVEKRMTHESIVYLAGICQEHSEVARRIKTPSMDGYFVIEILNIKDNWYSSMISVRDWTIFSFLKTIDRLPETFHKSRPEDILYPFADNAISRGRKQGIFKEEKEEL